MKQITAPVMQNPIGAIVGGVALYWASHKYAGVSNTYARIGLAVVGLYVGAYAQKQVSAMMSKPTATTTK
jgi:hypothetical protein